jgi:uncharacterized membrane protein
MIKIQMEEKKIVRNVFVCTLAGTLVWLSLIFLAPYLKRAGISAYAFIYSIFAPICHQNPSRCFTLFGYPLAVCTRCLGIYFGFFLGTIVFPAVNGFKKVKVPGNRLFFAFTAPIVIDTAGNLFHLWQTSDWLRYIIGLTWGTLLPYYLIAGLSELFLSRKHFS